LFVVMKLWTWK